MFDISNYFLDLIILSALLFVLLCSKKYLICLVDCYRKYRIKPLSPNQQLKKILENNKDEEAVEYQTILLKLLQLKKIVVEDIMVPHHEIVGINLSEDWDSILKLLINSQYTRLPLYEDNINHVIGVLHVRHIMSLLAAENLDKDKLIKTAEPAYFIPENTTLNVQLLNFRKEKRRSGFVVNEYGDIKGLVTLEDILEEVIGEFTTDINNMMNFSVSPQADGSFLVDGSISVRQLNHLLDCRLKTKGPRTLSGLIIEYLETIPQAGTSLKLDDQPLEIMQVKDNMIKTVKILPQLKTFKVNDQDIKTHE